MNGICTLAILITSACPLQVKPVSIQIQHKKDGPLIAVQGLDKDTLAALAKLPPDSKTWSEVLTVRVDRSAKDPLPAMLGTYRIDKGILLFEPRFPLTPGLRYLARFDPAPLRTQANPKPIRTVLSLPKPARTPTTSVRAVYPTTDRLPENQLKFYLHFSAPMSQGEAYHHIKLLDAKGKPVDLPFLELHEELWDPTGTRFTLFFDPGRIKRGLKPREEVGPALEEGKRYTLVIDRAWCDAQGTPLKETFRKSFSVAAPDDHPPHPRDWKLSLPSVRTRQPLKVSFPEPMDHALAQRLLWVEYAGKKLLGSVALSDHEKVWTFTPDQPWPQGDFHLVTDTRLEDLAGNSIGRPFEVDVLRPVERVIKKETVKVAFRLK